VVLLGGVGLYLALVFGLRAVGAHQAGVAIQRALADPARTLLCSPADAYCNPVDQRGEWLIGQLDRFDAARRQLRPALVAAAFGLLALLAGLGSLPRRQVLASWHGWATSLVTTVWGAGEGLTALVCLQVLESYAYVIVVLLSLGEPLTRGTLDLAADGMVAVISKIGG
jgi:hypothetical protein